jgi:hypothetical protein
MSLMGFPDSVFNVGGIMRIARLIVAFIAALVMTLAVVGTASAGNPGMTHNSVDDHPGMTHN